MDSAMRAVTKQKIATSAALVTSFLLRQLERGIHLQYRLEPFAKRRFSVPGVDVTGEC
jgi:hypothetical protein